ncbi:Phenylacetaldoxime dehydratase [Fusarium oxysporum f. sp. rapae]|uniref:Phenylacetaldoxime dehydratase n=1 Tax=Fusarium oxysporum f. sp. rapae TaxID=485398 RepID=A0A8J5TM32_FUSOX|nr:Phenylacetaldoxime dehydratase [Fusarium oxysporum f. sp. rapae]
MDRDQQKTYATSLIGVQCPAGDDSSMLVYKILGMLAADDVGRPLHIEQSYYIDSDGYRNHVIMPYWNEFSHMNKFITRDDFKAFRNAPCSGPLGWWMETFWGDTSAADVAGATNLKSGIGRHSGTVEEQYHSYMGSMRDRVPDYLSGSADGRLSKLARQPPTETKGRHLIIDGLPHNICYIRGPFGFKHAPQEQQDAFHEIIMPTLIAAADYLSLNPIDSGCISMRRVEEMKIGFDNEVDTEILGWFLTLQDLERWTRHHPSHLRVLKSATEFFARFDNNVSVTEGHEVFVIPEGQLWCEYVNCHAKTGFLPYFATHDMVN